MWRAYESIQELNLDCLEASADGDGCVKWRSDVERQMIQSISGWHKGDVVKSAFAPLGAVLFGVGAPVVDADMDGDAAGVAEENVDTEPLSEEMQHTQMAKEVFAVLENVNLKFETKLRTAAQMLACAPTFTGVGGALSRLVLCCQDDDVVQKPLRRYQCRLCRFGASGGKAFWDHIVEKHSGGADDSRALIEYRNKVIGLATHLGP